MSEFLKIGKMLQDENFLATVTDVKQTAWEHFHNAQHLIVIWHFIISKTVTYD